MTGRLLRLSIKPETPGEYGLPKRAVPELTVTAAGAEGDYNRYRSEQLPGDRDQALLLMTQDLLDTLRGEGWPVEPGDLGENLTLGGIPESNLSPGVRIRLGGVEIEVSKACDPCTEVHSLPYIGAERGPAFVRALVGRRGWYARVLTGGRLDLATPVEIVPDGVIIPDAR
jgi:MOSC domain-containing protein YiiM